MTISTSTRRPWRRSALAMAAGALALALAQVNVAQAQSNTTGSIYGQVSGGGATILIEGIDIGGFRREVTPDASGKYQVLSMPAGQYKVSLLKGGKVDRSDSVVVSIGQSREVSFAETRIEVTGRLNRIDVANTNFGASFSARDLERLPVATNLASVIQLAPATVPGDPRYGGKGAPSFGGSSASENSYYINGYPVTNPLTQVGFSSLPFGAVAQTQILTGGYGAEFGRATGGVVNVTTKSGTDRWEVGGALSWAPNALRAKQHDIVYPNDGTSSDGQIRQYLNGNKRDERTVSAYAGGPLIADKLFMFVAAEQSQVKSEGTRVVNTDPTSATAGWEERTLNQPKLLGKLDWNISTNHHLEYTLVRDNPEDKRKYFGFDYATLQRNNTPGGEVTYKSYGPTPIAATVGGNVDILKYTGNFTDDLTVTALIGRTKIDRSQNQVGYNPNNPQILVTDAPASIKPVSAQPFTDDQFAPGSFNKTSGYRLDAEYRINDKHTVRLGLDNVKLDSYSGTYTSGGKQWNYQSDSCTDPKTGLPVAIAAPGAPNVPTNLQNGNTCYFVSSHVFRAVNPAKVDQSAEYVEDRWQVTKDVMLALGLRSESFTNYNDVGVGFIKQKNQIEPRLGLGWDIKGDASLKLTGSAGRYHLQMPANVTIRGAGASTFVDQYFSYTGVDPVTGAPTGTTALTVPFSPDGETGTPKDVGYVAAKDLKSHYQDEFAVGLEFAATKSLNVGGKLTYRELKNTLEDFCDPRPIQNWAKTHGVKTDKFDGTGAFAAAGPAWSCAIINPGQTNTFDLDIDGDGKAEHVVLSPTDMAGGQSTLDGSVMPKATRTYMALDFFAEHPFDGQWYGKINYTWSRSEGNTEGQLNSDLGQADPATTVTYDFKELMEYSKGYLPNDRRHVIKAFGYYSFTPEFAIGANLVLASGRPEQCLGKYPDSNNLASQSYGSSLFHYCSTNTLQPSVGTPVPSPRGTAGRLPWTKTLDLNFAYKPDFAKGVTAKIDVFNVLDSQTAVQVRERALPASRYHLVENYTDPRSVKFTLAYDKKF